MKKILLSALLLFLPLSAGAESITSFESDITLGNDGAFNVEETITYDFGPADRHGIFRFIPTDHADDGSSWLRERYIDVEILSVELDRQAVPYEVSENMGKLEVKIGDPDRTITGEHIYEIAYRVKGALYYYDDGKVDLYWNATGDGWEVPIERAVARVSDGPGVYLNDGACYRGDAGSSEPCDISISVDAVDYRADDLAPGEGLTVARSVDPSKVERLILERWSLWPLWLIGALAWFIWLGLFAYRYRREHQTGASIIAQYEPYRDLKPMYVGLLFDGRIDPRDITAGIVYLAEQGFFKIRHVGRKLFFLIDVDDYEIELLRSYEELDSEFQKSIFKLTFEESAVAGDKVLLSKLAGDTGKQKENHRLLTELRAAAEKDLVAQGFFEHKWQRPLKTLGYLSVILLLSLGASFSIGADMVAPTAVSLFAFVMSFVVLLFAYRRRTRKGYEALDHLKGFKEFLSVTDTERFKFHNAPQKSPEQFMAYLPYAIAFGVEKEWAEAFKDITIPEPDWYEGQGTTFNAVYLSQSLGTFGKSVASASASSPASSGGGSSGGGAGGGGGGSW